MERIEFLKQDLMKLRKELEEYQEMQIKALEELSKVEDLNELDSELESLTRDFEIECEGLLKEVFYVNKKIFENIADEIWEEAKERTKGGEVANV